LFLKGSMHQFQNIRKLSGQHWKSKVILIEQYYFQHAFQNSGPEVVWTIIGFCWFSVLLSLYAVIIGCPPEAATFRALDTLEIGVMSRYLKIVFMYCKNAKNTKYKWCTFLVIHFIPLQSFVTNTDDFFSNLH